MLPRDVTVFTKNVKIKIVVHLTSSCVNWAFFGMSGPVYNTSEASSKKSPIYKRRC
jgi:hypothetical protein